MKTLQDEKHSDKAKKTGAVRMGREVSSKGTSGCDSETDSKCSDKKKEENREGQASSSV